MENIHPIFPILEKALIDKTGGRCCRVDFPDVNIQVQRPILNHLPEEKRYIFLRHNFNGKEEEFRLYKTGGIEIFIDGGLKESYTPEETIRNEVLGWKLVGLIELISKSKSAVSYPE